MFHKGARVSGGSLPKEVHRNITLLLDEFINIVIATATAMRVKRAVVRSQLPCNIFIILDDASVSVGAEKASGMPSTIVMDNRGRAHSVQAVYEAAKWEFGFAEPFVVQFPASLLDQSPGQRRGALEAISRAHVESEINRAQKEMNTIQINPIFGPAAYSLDPRLAFVLMPFHDDLTMIYDTIVKPTIQSSEFNLVCKRADDIKSNKAIIQDIFKAICEARLVLADLTRLNPNVMYELGIAHTLGKETILIYQKEEEIKFPFDLAHIRRIEYANDATGGKRLELELAGVLRNILSPSIKS